MTGPVQIAVTAGKFVVDGGMDPSLVTKISKFTILKFFGNKSRLYRDLSIHAISVSTTRELPCSETVVTARPEPRLSPRAIS